MGGSWPAICPSAAGRVMSACGLPSPNRAGPRGVLRGGRQADRPGDHRPGPGHARGDRTCAGPARTAPGDLERIVVAVRPSWRRRRRVGPSGPACFRPVPEVSDLGDADLRIHPLNRPSLAAASAVETMCGPIRRRGPRIEAAARGARRWATTPYQDRPGGPHPRSAHAEGDGTSYRDQTSKEFGAVMSRGGSGGCRKNRRISANSCLRATYTRKPRESGGWRGVGGA